MRFKPTVGKRYKIEVVDVFGAVKASHIDTCITGFDIGTTSDQASYHCTEVMAGVVSGEITFVAKGLFEFTATIYEEVKTVKPLDEKYLPDSVVLENELTTKGYQTEEQVTTIINNALGGFETTAITIEEIDEICGGTLDTFLEDIAAEEVAF